MAKKTVGAKYEYEMVNKLGSGAFAEVFRGRNKVTNEVVAIKVIKRSLLAKYGYLLIILSDDMLRQIHQEVTILQQLVQAMKGNLCPFINKIYECMETTNNIYIVLEFCNQGTLLDQVKQTKKLPEDQAIFVIFQLAQALNFLSQNNIAHRDIKPENVFVKDGVYKLGDFGFAGQKSLYQTHLGTYPYMAPEFFNSDQYDGSQIDVWALGLLFHEILFGEIYFIGNSQYEVTQKILNKKYEIKAEFTSNDLIRDLLPRMVEKDKKKRITAAQIVEHPLFNQIKKDQRYLTIMQKERVFMDALIAQDSQTTIDTSNDGQAEEERQRREEELRQLQYEQELQQKNEKQKQLIKEGVDNILGIFNDMRNGVTLLVQLCEFLQVNFIEPCRYDIFYILKQAMIQITRMKEKLDHYEQFTAKDHIGFVSFDSNIWQHLFQDRRYGMLTEDIESDRNSIRKSYIDYYNYINNFTATSYPQYLNHLQTQTNLDFTNPIAEQLFQAQIYSTMKFFSEELVKTQQEDIKQVVKKALIWLYVASKYDELFNGELLDVDKFMLAADQSSIELMKQLIKA